MNNLFDLDSKVYRSLSYLIDLLLLNAIFLLTCLPILTIGAGWVALLSVFIKRSDGNENSVMRLYWDSLKLNLKDAMRLEVMVVGLLLLIVGATYLAMTFQIFALPIIALIFTLLIIVNLLVLVVSPYIARYQDSFANSLKSSCSIFLALPFQIIRLTVLNGSLLFIIFSSTQGLITMLYIFTFIGFALLALINVHFLKKIFEKIEN